MGKLAVVEAYTRTADADAARLYLEDNGITAYVEDGEIVAMDWLLGSAVGGVKVKVAEEDLQRASELLAETKRKTKSERTDASIAFLCEECGKGLCFPSHRSGGVETCKHCGKFVDVPDAASPQE